MKTKVLVRGVLSIIVIATAALPALADDVFPPDWRGNAGTITAAWDLWGPPGPGPGMVIYYPDQIIANPGGFDPLIPAAYAAWDPWCYVHDIINGRESVLEVNSVGGWGPVHFGLLNYEYPNQEKRIRLQITSMGPGILDFYLASGTSHPGLPPWPPLFPTRVDAIVSESFDHGDGWVTRAYDLLITPNPKWETIYLDWGYLVGFDSVYIDQVVIDTYCVTPSEPTWAAATGDASVYGSRAVKGSAISNTLAVFLIPVGAVLFLRIWRRKR